MEKVYLKINEKGETLNVFDSLGMAICGIEQEAKRIFADLIEEQTLTRIVWHEKPHPEVKHSRTIMECPICNNVTLDYMDGLRPVARKL